jgi:hypothetical protein
MAVGNKIIIVELRQPYEGTTLWVFGGKAAIYHYLPMEVVGVTLNTLQSKINLQSEAYTTRTGAVISQHTLLRAKTNRGKRKE